MSEELTEKLKQGNLKDGYYYTKMPTGCIDVVSLYNLRQLRLAKDGDKIEVLSPVLSFEETVMMIAVLDKMEEEIKELKTKSAKALEYYNNVNINCNYPDKVSRLKSYIKRLIEEREKLKERNDSLNNRDINLCRIANGIRDENFTLKELLKECKRQFEEVELCRYDVADTDQEDWFKISTEQASIANEVIIKINQALEMLQNSENAITHEMQHCESQTNLHITDE